MLSDLRHLYHGTFSPTTPHNYGNNAQLYSMAIQIVQPTKQNGWARPAPELVKC